MLAVSSFLWVVGDLLVGVRPFRRAVFWLGRRLLSVFALCCSRLLQVLLKEALAGGGKGEARPMVPRIEVLSIERLHHLRHTLSCLRLGKIIGTMPHYFKTGNLALRPVFAFSQRQGSGIVVLVVQLHNELISEQSSNPNSTTHQLDA